MARWRLASAASISVLAGTLPPESFRTSFKRERLARDSATVACVWASFASAELRSASDRAASSLSFERSTWARSWPFVTLSLSSTKTDTTRPETSLPTSICLIGARFPVADIATVRFPRTASTVTYSTFEPFVRSQDSSRRAIATTATADAAMIKRFRLRVRPDAASVPRTLAINLSGFSVLLVIGSFLPQGLRRPRHPPSSSRRRAPYKAGRAPW